jgi:hypothetical protein
VKSAILVNAAPLPEFVRETVCPRRRGPKPKSLLFLFWGLQGNLRIAPATKADLRDSFWNIEETGRTQ